MDGIEKLAIFKKELKFILDKDIRNFAELALVNTPDYFFTVPASSSGRNHPAYAREEGGLVAHTKACMMIAVEMFRMDMFTYSEEEKDIILVSLLLYDTRKQGEESEGATVAEHPLLARMSLINNADLWVIPLEKIHLIADNISTHMGQWVFDYTGQQVLDRPQTKMQKFVHICDYIASRKFLEVNFDVKITRGKVK